MCKTPKYPVINNTKECSKCHEIKPTLDFKKVKEGYEAQCIVCRREGSRICSQRPEVKERRKAYMKAYRQRPEIKEGQKEKRSLYGKTHRAQINKYKQAYAQTERGKLVNKAQKAAWLSNIKKQSVAYKGGKCICCGYADCLAAMDFHHIDPKSKKSQVTSAVRPNRVFERNKEELDKCVLLCVRCHREFHAGFRSLPIN